MKFEGRSGSRKENGSLRFTFFATMNVDHHSSSKKRKAPAATTSVEHGDPEAPAYNEDAKARFRSLQADAEMQYEDDFEDEYDEDDVGEGMDVAENPDEEPQDDLLPEEEEETTPEVRAPPLSYRFLRQNS